MKKNYSVLAVFAALLLAAPAFGAVLMSDSFSYPDGDIPTVSGGLWVLHSGTDGPYVVSGEVLLDLVNSAAPIADGDVNRGFAARTATDKVYACFQVRVTGNVPGSGTYFAHFRSSLDFIYPARVFVMNEPALTSYTIGIAATSAGTITQPWTTALNFGQTYNVVSMYDAATGTSQLWIDPVTEASPSVTSVNAAAVGDVIDEYALRQAGGVNFVYVDNLTVGETFVDVCGGATPTVNTSWGRVKALYR